jgi:hypothetical protein
VKLAAWPSLIASDTGCVVIAGAVAVVLLAALSPLAPPQPAHKADSDNKMIPTIRVITIALRQCQGELILATSRWRKHAGWRKTG